MRALFTQKEHQGVSMEQSENRRLTNRNTERFRALQRPLLFGLLLAFNAITTYAQSSPWETAVQNLQTSFTGPIAKGLSLVALVIGGLMFAYSEGASKKVFAGLIFGLGMALGAANFMAWMFP
jgi:type IV secretory pathway VirB2 component (pilin)